MKKLSLLFLSSCSLLINRPSSTCGDQVLSPDELCYGKSQRLVESLSANAVRVGDVNGDGSLDIVTLNFGFDVGLVTIFFNDGAGNFSLVQEIDIPQTPSANPEALQLVDLDGDGALDVVSTNFGNLGLLEIGETVSIFFNDGTGTFSEATSLQTGTSPALTTVSDWNNDGSPDLAVLCFGLSEISVLLNDGTGQFAPEIRVFLGGSPDTLISNDLDLDGDNDILIGDFTLGLVRPFINDGTGQFAPNGIENLIASEIAAQLIAAQDLDLDGITDLFLTNPQSGGISLMRGLGSGRFDTPQIFSLDGGAVIARLADMNLDGVLDAIIAGEAIIAAEINVPAAINIVLGDGSGGFLSGSKAIIEDTPFALDLADLNGDSILDVVYADASNFNEVRIFLSRP